MKRRQWRADDYFGGDLQVKRLKQKIYPNLTKQQKFIFRPETSHYNSTITIIFFVWEIPVTHLSFDSDSCGHLNFILLILLDTYAKQFSNY